MNSSDTLTNTITEKLLIDWNQGDQGAFEKLIPYVEEDLHRLAKGMIRKFYLENTWEEPALINETYLKLLNQNIDFENQAHFFGIAAHLMRRILLNYLRDNKRKKRDVMQVDFEEALTLTHEKSDELLLLDDALNRLAKFDERKSKVIELQFFGGLNNSEIAEVLKVSPSTVARDYAIAKVWLARELRNDDVITNNQVSRNEHLFLRQPNFSETELQGKFQPNRRPWRAMLRVTRVEDENLWVVLPGWNSEQEVQISKNAFPKKLQRSLSTGERFFAKVNIGAEDQSELYFIEFEERP